MEQWLARADRGGRALGQLLRHIASLLVGLAGGYLVLLCANAIGLILTVPNVFLSSVQQEEIGLSWLRYEPWFIAVIAGTTAFLTFHTSLALARYLLRLFPIHPTRPRWKLLAVLTLAYAAFAVREIGRASAWFVRPRHDAFAVAELISEGIVVTLPVFVLLRWHLAWSRAGGGNYFVYLRKFGAISDRAVYQSVLGALGHRHQPVFLVPRTTPFLNWEPFGAAFAGLSLRHPFRSIPVALSVGDAEWEQQIRELCKRSSLVVADISVDSSSLQSELRMIASADMGNRLVLLRSATSSGAALPWKGETHSLLVVTYRLRWRIGIIALQAGLLLSWAAAIFHYVGATAFSLGFVPLVVVPILPVLVQRSTYRADFDMLRLRPA